MYRISFIFLTILLNYSNSVLGECPSNFFDCGNEKCIAVFWRCDGEDDCGNWEDEHGCDDQLDGLHLAHTCPLNHFHCKDTLNTCIPDKWVCDGMRDCDSGSDESNCSLSKVSNDCIGFLCKNFQCIPSRWRCDRFADCLDESDEHNCVIDKMNANCTKAHGSYQCFTGECISHEKVCDHNKDCPQGDDEGLECRPGGCHHINCSHYCYVSPHGPECYCPEGYELNSDGLVCDDINECSTESDKAICSQQCINTNGSYKCSCSQEYDLINNKSCRVKEGEPLILFSNSEGIRGIWLTTKRYFSVYPSIKQSLALDMFGTQQRVYWIDLDSTHSGIYSVDLSGESFRPEVTTGLKAPEDLAIDWIGANIYITDSSLNKIIVCKLVNIMCATLLSDGIHLPRGIVVDPSSGSLYWTEWGTKPGIYTAGMDGSNRSTLLNEHVIWPNGLTHDIVTNRLYFSEAKIGSIEYYDISTKQRKLLLEDTVFHPYSISVFEDSIYWSDWTKYSLDTCNKFTGHNHSILIRETDEHILGVHVYHPVMQKSYYNPCWQHMCSHLCLIAPNGRYSCSCPDHMILDADGKTCVANPNISFVFLFHDNRIKKFYAESIGKDILIDLIIPSHLKVGDLAFNWNSQSLFIFDVNKFQIVSINLEKPHSYVPIVDSNLHKVEGLTYDTHTNNLYWLEVTQGILEVSTTDGSARAVIIKDLDRPIDLALFAERRRMYIAIVGHNPRIIVADMDGQNRKTLIESLTGLPISLTIDKPHNRLFWANATYGKIEWLELVNSKEQKSRRGVAKKHLGYVTSIAIFNDSLYWTDLETDYLYHDVYPHKARQPTKTSVNFLNHKSVDKKILIAYKEENSDNWCAEHNGGCSHICLLGRYEPSCHCPIAYQLSHDLKTCVKVSEDSGNNVLVKNEQNFNDDHGLLPHEYSDEYDLNLFEINNQEDDDYVDIMEKQDVVDSESNFRKHHNNDKKLRLSVENIDNSFDADVDKKNFANKDSNGNNAKSGNPLVILFVAFFVVVLLVLLVIGLIRKNNYRKIGNAIYKRTDRLRGRFNAFHNPIYQHKYFGKEVSDKEKLTENTEDLRNENPSDNSINVNNNSITYFKNPNFSTCSKYFASDADVNTLTNKDSLTSLESYYESDSYEASEIGDSDLTMLTDSTKKLNNVSFFFKN